MRHCHMCGTELTGKQRRWCSEACRKRAARIAKSVRELRMPDGYPRPGLSGLHGDKIGERHMGRLVIYIDAVQTVEAIGSYRVINHLRMYQNCRKWADLLEAEMNRTAYGHQVFVTVKLT